MVKSINNNEEYGILSFKTDKFSTYALVYRDVKHNNDNLSEDGVDAKDSKNDDSENTVLNEKIKAPQTGDTKRFYWFIIMMSSVFCIVCYYVNKYKRLNKK